MNIRDVLLGACRYWEPKRVIYNVVLALFTVAVSYREFVDVVDDPPLQILGLVVVLGIFCVLANVCYCVAYVPDVILQLTPLSQLWQRCRWVLFVGGTLLACVCVVVVFYYPHPM